MIFIVLTIWSQFMSRNDLYLPLNWEYISWWWVVRSWFCELLISFNWFFWLEPEWLVKISSWQAKFHLLCWFVISAYDSLNCWFAIWQLLLIIKDCFYFYWEHLLGSDSFACWDDDYFESRDVLGEIHVCESGLVDVEEYGVFSSWLLVEGVVHVIKYNFMFWDFVFNL
jgi:hypothetical protein